MTPVAAKLGIASVSRAQIIETVAAGRRVWVLSNTPDLPFLAELSRAVRLPADEKQWLCGKSPCITAVEWAPGRECQKPGALRRELDCLVAQGSVQHCEKQTEQSDTSYQGF